MELIHKLEHWVHSRVRNVPHLPVAAQRWLGKNVWWIVLVGVILGAISLLFSFGGLLITASLIGSASSAYFVFGAPTAYSVFVGFVSLLFTAAVVAINAFAIQPLKAMQKKGWVLLFLSFLVSALSVVVNAILTLNPFSFIFGILFGAIFLAIAGYFLFEIHGQFNHDATARRVAKAKKAKKA